MGRAGDAGEATASPALPMPAVLEMRNSWEQREERERECGAVCVCVCVCV